MKYTYYFNVKSLYLMPGFDTVMLNRYAYPMKHTAVLEDEHVLVPLEDMKTIFAHVYDVLMEGEKAVVVSENRKKCVEIKNIDGMAMVAVDEILCDGFGYRRMEKTTVERNHIILLTCDENVTEIEQFNHKYIDNLIRGKAVGDRYETFWFEEGTKLVPYRIYLPTYYDPAKKYPTIYTLHGGNGNPCSNFDRSNNMLQYYAEKLGFLVVGVDGFIKDATYGYCLPPNPGDPRIDPTCPENPLHHSPEKLMEFALGRKALEATIDVTAERYGVDRGNLFLQGNSMGGEGSFWFALEHPGMFNAICPAGAMINTKLVNLEPLKDLPILFVGGTEDRHGFDYLMEGVQDMEVYGLNIEHIYVGGGDHPSAWATVLADSFEFFCRYVKK